MTTRSALYPVMLAVAVLTACGGGGGGETRRDETITQARADQIARAPSAHPLPPVPLNPGCYLIDGHTECDR